MDLFDRFQVIDVDTHITEPADTWTSRVSKKYIDKVPHIERIGGVDQWVINGKPGLRPGIVNMAGFDGRAPVEFPSTYDEFHPGGYDPHERIKYMDEQGIYAQVLYPNVGGFGAQRFLQMDDEALMLTCVKAYNDFQSDWASVAPNRLIPVTSLPFWDVAKSVAEIERCAKKGHRSVLFPSQPQDFGFKPLAHPSWDPIWAAAQDANLAISFHLGSQEWIGGAEGGNPFVDVAEMGIRATFARVSALAFMGLGLGISEILVGGVCHRFPKLKFVAVESGVSWLPSLLEALDWQWENAGGHIEHPDYLLPSEYFRRQVYACFWFEQTLLKEVIALYPDNILWETDFPHPTSMTAGPATPAQHPRDYASEALAGLSDEMIGKVLHDNAARVYHVH